MSLEMILFLEKSRIPERATLQNEVDSLGLPLQFDRALNLVTDRGFSPSSVKGTSSGFEIYSQSVQEVLPGYPQMRDVVGTRDWTITLRWGNRMSECACVLAASAAMVKQCDAVAYYPADDITYTVTILVKDFQDCLKQV